MESSQLRIGNYYTIAENDGIKYKRVTYLIPSAGDWFSDGDNITHAAKPIPLTEEWLLKFGFKYQDRDINRSDKKPERFYISRYFGQYHEYWIEMQLATGNAFNHSFMWLNWNIGGGNNHIHLPEGHKMEYIHQLQNLYFALTGEELTIK
jgi:hypothetical protein